MKYIDERVRFRGVSTLRAYSSSVLREFSKGDKIEIIQSSNKPLAVIVPYPMYMKIQKFILEVEKECEEQIF